MATITPDRCTARPRVLNAALADPRINSNCRIGYGSISNLAERIWKLHCRRNREVGQGHPGPQHQGGVRPIRRRYSINSPFRESRQCPLLADSVEKVGTKRTWRGVFLFVRFWGEADMHRGAASSASVATDPEPTQAGRFRCDAQARLCGFLQTLTPPHELPSEFITIIGGAAAPAGAQAMRNAIKNMRRNCLHFSRTLSWLMALRQLRRS
jgi:hypothetical protein